ncbi:peptide deformylase [Ectothiorhodospira haloalkaliphila]|uniref:Peptide deformylase n=1 Tax=Ectothiorhodospira haloalkaliphila TaxID=421628 RepID=W8L253_9GAMM|nr:MULTISPECIES: peptide deformylase [Ectothiorhodospira]AHK78030.1 peptide deformylase [Ectothiorhodospira haloalkaliphila]MCG5494265.1 peptide deformylase [Ectothiorhodospira variabilis]MCG5496430.1 peptide deformylase [Ectothiorhodospira variabilis]MCG5504789.1 peptide deformylase [Ectothiorhodospira variabilis]MCG5507946.1 peptide deformylase [Ectothiorhodospira variabilis]
MALLEILRFPDPRLRRQADPVKVVDGEIRKLVDDMFETMYASEGIGLAAVQVNVLRRVIVMDVAEEGSEERSGQGLRPLCFINPEIVDRWGEADCEEGCLSVPGYYEPVTRAERIRVRALDRNGKRFEMEASGLLGVCIQHEIDHLDGKLFVDHLSKLKRDRIRKKLEKTNRHGTPNRATRQREAV